MLAESKINSRFRHSEANPQRYTPEESERIRYCGCKCVGDRLHPREQLIKRPEDDEEQAVSQYKKCRHSGSKHTGKPITESSTVYKSISYDLTQSP